MESLQETLKLLDKALDANEHERPFVVEHYLKQIKDIVQEHVKEKNK